MVLILKFYIALKSQRTACKKYTYVYLESLAIEFSRSFAAKCECRPLSFFLTISLGFSTMLQLWLTYSILYIKCISINNNTLLKLADLSPTRVYESDECKMHGEKCGLWPVSPPIHHGECCEGFKCEKNDGLGAVGKCVRGNL